MAPMKPYKRSQSTQSYYSRVKINRESVKPKRESIARTPSTVPVDVQEAPCGVYRVPNIPNDCRKGAVHAERARRAFVTQLTNQYAQQNKVVVRARWMADGLALDWRAAIPRGSNITNIDVANVRNGDLVSMNRSTAPLPPSMSSTASTRGAVERNARRNRGRYDSFASHRAGYRPRVPSKRTPRASFVHRSPEYSRAAMHRYGSNNGNLSRLRDSQTLPSEARRPLAMQSQRAPLNPDINQEEPPNRFQYLSSSHSLGHASIAPAPAAKDPMLHAVPQGQTSNHRPYSSPTIPLVKESTGNSASASKNSPMGERTQPPRHPAPLESTHDVLTDAHGTGGAKGQSPSCEGSESDVSMEYEFHAPAKDIDMDDNTTEVQNSDDSEDEESSVGSSPRVSVHREESPPVTRSSEKLRFPLYKVARNMPMPLPKAPFARARRLLIPSDSSEPIAWASMPGDMHFIDGSSRTRITRYSLPATDDQRFCLADVCKLGDGYYIQAHITGPYRFSIIKAPSSTQGPERSNLLKMKPSIGAGINTIISIGDRDFVTGNNKHIIRFWRLLSEEEGPQVTRTEAIKGRHKSAVKALAMGDHTLWSSSGYHLLGIDVPSMQTVLEPITRASRSISQIHYHQRFLTLETMDHDTPFRVYDTRTINATQDEPVVKFGLSPHKSPSSFRKGAWINTTFAHGFTDPVTKVEQLLLWDLRKTSRPTQRLELGHAVTHCVFWKGGKGVVVTGGYHVSFLHL